MSSRYEELLNRKEKLEKKIKQQEARLQLKYNSESNKKRKARTRALIQKGALLEKYFNVPHLSVEDTEALLLHFSNYVKANMPERFEDKNPPT